MEDSVLEGWGLSLRTHRPVHACVQTKGMFCSQVRDGGVPTAAGFLPGPVGRGRA